MIQFKANNPGYFNMKVIVTIVLLLTSNLLGFTQDLNERKQLFDYDWKFFLGDTVAAKEISRIN
jgi:beta-galactosidase